LIQRAKAINDTWSRHCDYFYFVAASSQADLPIVTYQGEDSYNVSLLKKDGLLTLKHEHESFFFERNCGEKQRQDSSMLLTIILKRQIGF